jgi:hypothetical protein
MLHRSSSCKKNAHVVWDEDNLKENAEVQKEYSHCKIQEPKTPYHAPIPDGDVDDDMKPLDLDEAGKQQLLHGVRHSSHRPTAMLLSLPSWAWLHTIGLPTP